MMHNMLEYLEEIIPMNFSLKCFNTFSLFRKSSRTSITWKIFNPI